MTLEELQKLVEANATAIAKLTEDLTTLKVDREVMRAEMNERSKSTQQVVNLAFALIASATVAVVVKIALG